MTINDFIEQLKKTPREWKVQEDGGLRLHQCCPITAVDGRGLPATEYAECAMRLGLSQLEARWLVEAADNWPREARLRSYLLAACGLEEC